MQLSQLHIFLPTLRLPSGSLFLYIFEAEGVEAEEAITVLPKATPTCGTEQQKPLAEPLDLSLNIQDAKKAHKELSESQRKIAEM